MQQHPKGDGGDRVSGRGGRVSPWKGEGHPMP